MQTESQPERLFTVAEAAKILGLKCWQLRGPVKAGLIPSYRPFGPRRRFVRLSEVVAYINSHRVGG